MVGNSALFPGKKSYNDCQNKIQNSNSNKTIKVSHSKIIKLNQFDFRIH